MFIDMHGHTSGISHCCRIDYKAVIDSAKSAGFDALVITNHYTKAYFTSGTHKEWIEQYIEEWHNCRSYGRDVGLKLFCGIEVTFEENPVIHLLIYGADEAFLRENLFLCNKTQKELYNLCRTNNCALVQAHPFRGGASVMNKDFLDGIEINCHPKYLNSFSDEIITIAKENNLAVTVGCDYHADTYRPKGGMFIPDNIETDQELAEYILQRSARDIQIHQPSDGRIERALLTE